MTEWHHTLHDEYLLKSYNWPRGQISWVRLPRETYTYTLLLYTVETNRVRHSLPKRHSGDKSTSRPNFVDGTYWYTGTYIGGTLVHWYTLLVHWYILLVHWYISMHIGTQPSTGNLSFFLYSTPLFKRDMDITSIHSFII